MPSCFSTIVWLLICLTSILLETLLFNTEFLCLTFIWFINELRRPLVFLKTAPVWFSSFSSNLGAEQMRYALSTKVFSVPLFHDIGVKESNCKLTSELLYFRYRVAVIPSLFRISNTSRNGNFPLLLTS